MNRTSAQRLQQKFIYLCALCSLFGLTACGGARATPTPLPADIVRPVQPTPAYSQSAAFTLATPVTLTAKVSLPTRPVTQTTLLTLEEASLNVQSTPSVVRLPLEQTPSGLGIAASGAVLLDRPSGRVLVNLPAGATVTVTGKSADQRYLAAYTNEGIAGWVPVGQLVLFGADDLVTVSESVGLGPIATMVAQAMQPLSHTLVVTP